MPFLEIRAIKCKNFTNCLIDNYISNFRYVQDQILNNSDLIDKSLKSGAYVFVAGNAKQMPQAVRRSFVEVLIKNGMTEDDANNFIEKMEKTNRYQTECWS